jgi:penicillin-binding protein 1C
MHATEASAVSTSRRRLLPRLLLVAVIVTAGLAAARASLMAWIAHTPPLGTALETSVVMLDRQGRLLRAFAIADGRLRLAERPEGVDPLYLAMLIGYEDRRFWSHAGVDVFALARAGLQWITQGEIRSGGSTVTMQTARLLTGQDTRGMRGKLAQVRAALWLERHLDKPSILATYLTLAPFGGNLEGVRAASLAWLGREPDRLTPAEAALLVALPQAPERRRPDRHAEAARLARNRVLERARLDGILGPEETAIARDEPVRRRRLDIPRLAAHATERLRAEQPTRGEQQLTLDATLQAGLERLIAERAVAFGPRVSAALLAVDHRTGEVLAHVGSAGFTLTERRGYVDMTRAIRSPGSTLKPLIYGLAFEDGRAHPESLIEDRPSAFGGYVPANFDLDYQGTVSVRHALQLSLNIPAVKLLDAVGPARLVARLHRAGARPVLPDLSPPGLAVGLGGVGMSLTDLVTVYAALARGGRPVRLQERHATRAADGVSLRGAEQTTGPPVLEERAARMVASILLGAPAPRQGASGTLAFKTGTSYGYRDAWAIGFDGRHLVGVWVGRPDGAPVPGLIGIDAAAPILFEAFGRLGPTQPLAPAPAGAVAGSTIDLPPHLQRVAGRSGSAERGAAAPTIAYPPHEARVDLGIERGTPKDLVMKVRDGVPPFTWLVEGLPVAREPFARSATWTPDGPGYVTISVVDARGGAARVRILVQ